MNAKKYFSWVAAIAVSLAAFTSTAHAAAGEWEIVSDSDGFVTKRKSVEGSNIFAFRGETVVNTPIGKILSVFLDSSRRGEWVNRFHSSTDLQVTSEWDRTYWIRFATPFPTSDRDYVLNARGTIDEARRVVTANIKSVTHPKGPEDDCCVRAEAMGTYYRFEAVPGTGTTKMEVEVHTDPKGMLPGWMVNLIQKSWPKKTLLGLAAVASDTSVLPHPDFADWDLEELPVGLVQTEKKTDDATAVVAPPKTSAPVEAPAPKPEG